MFYTVYKIINEINGKYYIGKHQTKNIDDGYLGSGKLIKRAISKYGIENFTKEILYVFDNEQDMNEKESELVVVSEETYNICSGGHGGFGYINNNPKKFLTKKRLASLNPYAFKGHKHSEKSKRKMREKLTGEQNYRFGKPGTFKGQKHSEETKEKMRQKAKGRTPWNKGKKWVSEGVWE